VLRRAVKTLDEALAVERKLLEPLFRGPEAREGLTAFTEKRKPVYYQPS
jgi:hypothetical protein